MFDYIVLVSLLPFVSSNHINIFVSLQCTCLNFFSLEWLYFACYINFGWLAWRPKKPVAVMLLFCLTILRFLFVLLCFVFFFRQGILFSWELTLHGTSSDPLADNPHVNRPGSVHRSTDATPTQKPSSKSLLIKVTVGRFYALPCKCYARRRHSCV